MGGMQPLGESHLLEIKKKNCVVEEWQRSAEAGVKELKSRAGARLECTALDDIVKITTVLLLYKIKLE